MGALGGDKSFGILDISQRNQSIDFSVVVDWVRLENPRADTGEFSCPSPTSLLKGHTYSMQNWGNLESQFKVIVSGV